jgi:hypothetical protein
MKRVDWLLNWVYFFMKIVEPRACGVLFLWHFCGLKIVLFCNWSRYSDIFIFNGLYT